MSINLQEMLERHEFYQSHLDRVSRSFAFCIRQLQPPLREWVGLSYLLCRIVDTIEDSNWPSRADQLEVFRRFDAALGSKTSVPELENWDQVFPSGIPEGEVLLLKDSAQIVSDFHELPEAVRPIIGDLVLSMSQGMQHFSKQRGEGPLRLKHLEEVNQYCFFVAGVVGELLAKLLHRVEPRFDVSQESLLKAHHFGLFLQKVNLLKDQVSDQTQGRHLVPSREEVEGSAANDADAAIQFLLDLPLAQTEFRRFCAWSLFLGLEALLVARESLRENRVIKVARHRTEALLTKVEALLADNHALKAMFDELAGGLGWKSAPAGHRSGHDVPEWLLRLYRGPLDSKHLVRLGLT